MSRHHDDADPLPEWARFFAGHEQLARFEHAVLGDFERRRMRVAVEDGWVVVMDGDLAGEKFGLVNIGQTCATRPEPEWSSLIASHFDNACMVQGGAGVDLDLAHDFDAVRDRLVLRMFDEEALLQSPAKPLASEDIPGLATVLMIDWEKAAATVSGDQLADWPVSLDDAIDRALDNVIRMEEGIAPMRAEAAEGVSVRVLQGTTIYAGSLALVLDRFPDMIGVHGSVVSIPTRDAVCALPIDDARFVEALGAFIGMTAKLEHEGPGSVSPRLWWYHDEAWTPLPWTMGEDDSIEFTPPEEFGELLARLTEG